VDVEIADICDANVHHLFDWSAGGANPRDVGCRFCLYWEELDTSRWPDSLTERENLKRQWFRDVEAEFGPCGKLAFLGSKPVGYSQFAPPKYLPKVVEYTCGPPSDDTIFVSCLFVPAGEQRKGIGSALLQAILRDLRARGAQAVETFARKSSPNNCSGPLEFWLKHGFHIVREDRDFALVRRGLRVRRAGACLLPGTPGNGAQG
jgi:GNAT superfamily N-acetyltransferase